MKKIHTAELQYSTAITDIWKMEFPVCDIEGGQFGIFFLQTGISLSEIICIETIFNQHKIVQERSSGTSLKEMHSPADIMHMRR